ncbi:Formyl-coenzyme A transferase [Lasiodiplodia theobromae]|uniref:Formyl-coenzyme A transferase n=1 Tax=Lasiodiplodia theobromae TaxID=45133 RepID=UPI0015C3BC08|nr:Formyl-coenzyme A transferase [Lasiodiplodia theobromae]KAF4534014.1 Formyl-coenzyme A transferase [Lasiodiplodia theobromae]
MCTPNGQDVSEFSILTPNAMLGYGYRSGDFWYGITKYRPAAIIVDSGSTDGGPYKLGMNKMTCGKGSYIRDLEPILTACYHLKIKVLIGSVGGDGSTKHVKEMLDIVTGISERLGYSFKVATIDAGMNRTLVNERIEKSQVFPCGPVQNLIHEAVDNAVDIVAQMGAEPYIEALKGDPDIILGGRSYDPAPFAAFCMARGILPGVAWHMGKILECGGICAVPKGRSMIAIMRRDSFDLNPLAPEERCTPLSVAAHTLYEKTRPDRLPGPGGVLVLDSAAYSQITEKTVRVSGAEFIPTPYQVKLEGVAHLGYRTVFVGGIRDPILISQIDDFLDRVRKYTQKLFPELDQSEDCRLIFHIYGQNGVMGPLEPRSIPSHEIAVVGEVVAPTQELSHTIANNARASILHFSYNDQMATTGNFASPFSPHEQEAGAVFKFTLYHLMNLEKDEEVSLFPVSFHHIASNREPQLFQPISEEEIRVHESGTLAPLTYKENPPGRAKLSQVARVIRSKNSGPFELTFDVIFDNADAYHRVKSANVLTKETMQRLYNLTENEILVSMFFDPALAWKCTIKRPWAQGSVGERDTLGTQQHAPLLDIEVPPVENSGHNGVQGGGTRSRGHAVRDRELFTPSKIVEEIWVGLGLPAAALDSVSLQSDGKPALPSSFKIGCLAQSTIALSALAAALIHSIRNKTIVPRVTVERRHAAAEFKSEKLYILDGKPAPSAWGAIGGLHATADGYVRIHDSFPNHRNGALRLLGLDSAATRPDVTRETKNWASIDLETVALQDKLVIYALRTYQQWDVLPQAKALSDFPITIEKLSAAGTAGLPSRMGPGNDRSLRGLRVLELSRVIAAPLAGKTLAAHGADVLWVTSPTLPDLPAIDREFGRGKRTIQLDIRNAEDKERLFELIRTCDVLIQGFRPGSLAAQGLAPEQLVALNPNIICANMSAFGPDGPWAGRRGFDSIVQTCSGMNVSEAEHYGQGEPARPTPCQALDHGELLKEGHIA